MIKGWPNIESWGVINFENSLKLLKTFSFFDTKTIKNVIKKLAVHVKPDLYDKNIHIQLIN